MDMDITTILLIVGLLAVAYAFFLISEQRKLLKNSEIDLARIKLLENISTLTSPVSGIIEEKSPDSEKVDLINAIEAYEIDVMNFENEIKELREILDGQTTYVECVCGENMFQGVFVPNQNNEGKCNKCGESLIVKLEPVVSVNYQTKDSQEIFNEVIKKVGEENSDERN